MKKTTRPVRFRPEFEALEERRVLSHSVVSPGAILAASLAEPPDNEITSALISQQKAADLTVDHGERDAVAPNKGPAVQPPTSRHHDNADRSTTRGLSDGADIGPKADSRDAHPAGANAEIRKDSNESQRSEITDRAGRNADRDAATHPSEVGDNGAEGDSRETQPSETTVVVGRIDNPSDVAARSEVGDKGTEADSRETQPIKTNRGDRERTDDAPPAVTTNLAGSDLPDLDKMTHPAKDDEIVSAAVSHPSAVGLPSETESPVHKTVEGSVNALAAKLPAVKSSAVQVVRVVAIAEKMDSAPIHAVEPARAKSAAKAKSETPEVANNLSLDFPWQELPIGASMPPVGMPAAATVFQNPQVAAMPEMVEVGKLGSNLLPEAGPVLFGVGAVNEPMANELVADNALPEQAPAAPDLGVKLEETTNSSPELVGLMAATASLGLLEMEKAMDEFLDELNATSRTLLSLLTRIGPLPSLLMALAVTASLQELVRWRLKRLPLEAAAPLAMQI